jgi:hypothetical protein
MQQICRCNVVKGFGRLQCCDAMTRFSVPEEAAGPGEAVGIFAINEHG